MAERNPPYVIQGASHSGELFREASGSLIGAQGVVAPTDLAVTANGTPNMTVNVAVGAGWVKGTQNTFQGAYYCLNDAIKNLAIAAANATNPRIDLVAAVVQDTNYGGATNTWALTVVTGTAAPSPVAPALPANALQLASIAVAANATSIVAGNIGDSRVGVQIGAPRYRARMWRSAALSTGTGFIVVPCDTASWGAQYLTLGANAQYTAPVTGYYRVNARLSASASGAGIRMIADIYVNGADVARGCDIYSAAIGGFGSNCAAVVYVLAGQSIQFWIYCANAGLTVETGVSFSYMDISYEGQ